MKDRTNKYLSIYIYKIQIAIDNVQKYLIIKADKDIYFNNFFIDFRSKYNESNNN